MFKKDKEKSRIFVGNLPYEFTRQDIAQVFRDFKYYEINLPMDNSTGRNKGYTFIQLDNPIEAEKAKAHAERMTLQGRKLRVDYGDNNDRPKHRSFSDSAMLTPPSDSADAEDQDIYPGGPLKSTIKPPTFPSKFSLAHHNDWKAGDHCEARYSADRVWYAATIDEVVKTPNGNQRYVVTYTRFGNSEELSYEDLRAPTSSKIEVSPSPSPAILAPASIVPATPAASALSASTFMVGDVCEGMYTEDDTWYMCEIQEVLNNGALYKVIYTDYGNSEILPASRLRAPTFSENGLITEKKIPATVENPTQSSAGSLPNPDNKWQIGDKCQALVNDKWMNVEIDDATIKGNWFLVIPENQGEGFFVNFESLRPTPKIYKNWKVGDMCLGESAIDGKTREGIVVKVFSESCMVTFPDVARVETLSFAKLTPLGVVDELPQAQTTTTTQSPPKPQVETPAQPHISAPRPQFLESPPTISPPPASTTIKGLGLEQVQVIQPPSTPSLTGVSKKLILGVTTEKFKQMDLSNITPFVPKGK